MPRKINEDQTRKQMIDPQLEHAGWYLRDHSKVKIEIPVDGYDAEPWNGVTDYCLYRENGEVLAMVEAIQQGQKNYDWQLLELERTLTRELGEGDLEVTPKNLKKVFAHTADSFLGLVRQVLDMQCLTNCKDLVSRVESLRGRMGESTRQVEGLFESLLAQSFDGGPRQNKLIG
jgi:type I site-specific restriction endonuclease